MSSPMHKRAKELAQHGYKVFPCMMNGKAPATANGFYDATNDLEKIDAWWEENPLFNVGLPCGAANRLSVLDIDNHGADGIASFSMLTKIIGDNLLDYPAEFTPNDGAHYFFSDHDLPTLRKLTHFNLPGIELRGEGSYVVVWPSMVEGKEYSPFPSRSLVDERFAIPMPHKLREVFLLELVPRFSSHAPATFGNIELYDHPHPISERNNALFKLACDLQGLGHDDDAIYRDVSLYNETWCNPPLPDKEVLRTVASALRYEKGTRAVRGKKMAIEDEDKPFLLMRPGTPAEEIQEALYKPLTWIIEGLLPVGATQLVGPSKVGKSWFCLQLALAVASGGTFLSRGVERRRVLYMSLEDNERRVQDRMNMLHASPNMYRGYLDIMVSRQFRDMFFANMALPKCIDGLRAVIQEYGYELIIVDIVGRAFPLMDHNELESVLSCLVPYQEMAQELDVALLFVDHTKKSLGKEEDHLLQVGGSRGKSATYDTTMSLCRERNEMLGKLKVAGRDLEDVVLDVKYNAGMWQMQTEMERLGERENKIIDLVVILKGDATTANLRDRFNDWYEGKGNKCLDEGNFSRIINPLVDKGWLVRTKEGKANIYALGPKMS